MREMDHCPQCGGQNGEHRMVEVWTAEGRSEYIQCPLDARPKPTEPPVPLDLADALDALQDAAVRFSIGDQRTNEAYGTAEYFLVQAEMLRDQGRVLEAARRYGALAERRRKEIERNG